MPERVVFDTNIWISGLLWRGKAYQCLLLARAQVVQHVHCSETIAELSQKLRGTFGFSENHIRVVLYDLRRVSQTVAITGVSASWMTIQTTTSSSNAPWWQALR